MSVIYNKRIVYLKLMILFLITSIAFAEDEWATNGGSDIYNTNFGNVGIGTTSPSNKLDIVGGSIGITHSLNPYLLVNDTTNNLEVLTQAFNSYGVLGTGTNHPFSLYTSSTRRLTIDTNGNVGIGTTGPGAPFHIYNTNFGLLRLQRNGTNNPYWDHKVAQNAGYLVYRPSQSDSYHEWRNSDGTSKHRLSLAGSHSFLNAAGEGNVGIGTTSPSVKLHVIGPDVTSSTGWKSEIIAGAANNYQSQRVGFGLDASGPRSGIGLMWQGNTLFKVDNIGNVGIGTTSPAVNLDVHSTGADDSQILIGAAGTGIAELVLDASNGDAAGSDYLELYQTDDLDAHLRVAGGNGNLILQESGGNVGIGTTRPGKPLHVVTSTTDNGAKIESTNAGTHGASLVLYQNSLSPAPDDVAGRLQFNGKRDDGNEYWMAYIDGLWTNPAAGSGKSRMTFHTRSGETDNIVMT